METIGSLGLRKFRTDPSGQIVESTKTGASEAVHINLASYLDSKPYFSQSRVQIVPFNGHELLTDLLNRANSILTKEAQFSTITIYKSYMDIHGYMEKTSKGISRYPVLTPDVPISDIAFERVIAKLPLLGDERYQATLAVKWEPNFAQVALGLNVRVCDNYNIFAPRIWNTSLKLNYSTLMTYLDNELAQLERHFGADVQTIESLISTPLNERSVKLLIGDMSMRYAEDNQVLPITEINQLVRNIVADRKEGHTVENMWDFTNAGTRALHFNKSSGDTTLDTIARFNSYVLEMQGKHKRN